MKKNTHANHHITHKAFFPFLRYNKVEITEKWTSVTFDVSCFSFWSQMGVTMLLYIIERRKLVPREIEDDDDDLWESFRFREFLPNNNIREKEETKIAFWNLKSVRMVLRTIIVTIIIRWEPES